MAALPQAAYRRRTLTRLPFVVIAGLLLAFPAGVAANSNNPITQTGGMSATLPMPLLGTTLTVNVTLDGVGNIAGVTLDPATLSGTETAKDVVKFSNADGSTKVTVKASGDRLAIKAQASLDKLLGSGTWSANVFGPGTKATVAYTVGKDADGGPTVAIGDVTAAGGTAFAKLDPRTKNGKKWGWAYAGVTFTRDGFTKHLTISVSASKDEGKAKLAIVLSGRDRQKLTGTLESLGAPRVWSAKLCDGTDVSVKYHVATDGTVVYDGATGAPAKEHDLAAGGKGTWKSAAKGGKHKNVVSGIVVRFDKTRVGVTVLLLKNADGTYTLKIAGKSGFCGQGKGRHHGHHSWNGGHHGDGHRHNGDQKPKSKP